MDTAKFAQFLLLGTTALLPGCLAVNAALGVLGLVGPPTATLAGAAYTVAEYSYEYQVHNRTPDEVLEAKFDWLLAEGNDPEPAAFAGAVRAAVNAPRDAEGPETVMVAEAAAPAIRDTQGAVEPDEAVLNIETAAGNAPAESAPVAAAATRPPVVHAVAAGAGSEPPATVRALPAHILVAHDPDPLMARLNRIENGLARAEAQLLADGGEGIRLSVPPCDGDPCAQGVNGSWSLRLPVMRTVPAQSTLLSDRSRNT